MITDPKVLIQSNLLISYSPEDKNQVTLWDYSMKYRKKKSKIKKQNKPVFYKEYRGPMELRLEKPFDLIFVNKHKQYFNEIFVTAKKLKKKNELLLRIYSKSGNREIFIEEQKNDDFKMPLIFIAFLIVFLYQFCFKGMFKDKKRFE